MAFLRIDTVVALVRLSLWALCVLVVAAAPMLAQSDLDKATVSGTVRDASGAVTPGATVTVTSTATAMQRSTVTDAAGLYRIAALPPGSYDVRIELSGFTTTVFANVPLSVGQHAELPAVLNVAPTTTTVVVTGSARIIEPTRVGQATTLGAIELDGLPINQRNFLDFALLTPGVTGANALAMPTPTNSPTSGLSFTGQDQRSNQVTIDGADNMDAAVNSVRSTLSQDAVQEFQVLRNSFSAEFGRARAGIVNIVSKSGSNTTRGGGFAYFRDDALDARNVFAADLQGRPADPPFRRLQSGATLGGPLARDRFFYFGSYEHLRRRESTFVSALRDTRILRPTDSQQKLFDALGASGDPQLAAVAGLFANPEAGLLATTGNNFPGTLALLQHETGTFPFASGSHTGSLRLDGQVSTNSRLTARINFTDAVAEGNDVGGLRGVSSGTSNRTRNLAVVVSNTSVLTNRSVNIVRAQAGRFHTAVLPTDPAGPGLLIAGVVQTGRDLYNPTDYAWNILQAGETFLRSVGRHELKVGGDVVHMRSKNATAEVFLAGQFLFAEAIPLAVVLDAVLGPGATAAVGSRLGSPASAGGLGRPDLAETLGAPITALQSYNLGLPVVYLQGFGNPSTDITYTQLALFAQDEIRLGPRATLNAGVRYDTDWRDPSVNTAATPAPFTLRRSVIADRNNIAPRLGLAYTADGARRTVIRGGWGLFYQTPAQVSGFISRVLSGQISQVFLPLTGLPGINGTSADVWQRYRRDGRVTASTLAALGITPGTTPSVLLTGADGTPDAVSTQMSAGLDREITPDLAVSVEYSHNRGRNIIRSRDINVRSVAPGQFALPGQDPRFLQLNVLEATGRSSYHGVSLSVRKRFSRRWALLASYTLGRASDDVTDFSLETQPQDQTRLRDEWGPSSYDQRHRFVASAVFRGPSSGAVAGWLADWSLAPIVTYASGRPFNLLLGYDGNGDAHSETDRARLATGLSAGRNQGIGPAFFTVDVRIARQLRAGPRAHAEFTVEAFNLFNRTNFSGVNQVFGQQTAPAGRVHGSSDLPPTSPLGFTSAFAARQLQLGIRLKF